MRDLSDTLARLAALRRASFDLEAKADHLVPLADFGSNPGALKAYSYVPENLRQGAPLVVVLHGCRQTAAAYDAGSEWSKLAQDHGFALLFPEQTQTNNPNRCFSWFEPRHTRRGGGEALSIRQMISHMLRRHGQLDEARVYVTGLSAGGAMTAVMLATYPEVFAGGAIIAGLSFGSAATVAQAFDRMRGQGWPSDPSELGRLVRDASAHSGPWPTVSVWHGSLDHTVVPANAETLLSQWRDVHALEDEPDRTEVVDGHLRRVWLDHTGREVIESYDIAGLGHGVPLDVIRPEGPYMFNAGISSTHRIAAFWGLLPHDHRETRQRQEPRDTPRPIALGQPHPTPLHGRPTRPQPESLRHTIEQALRGAGLMR